MKILEVLLYLNKIERLEDEMNVERHVKQYEAAKKAAQSEFDAKVLFF